MAFNNIKKATELNDGNYVAIGVTIGQMDSGIDCGHSVIFVSKGNLKFIFHWENGRTRLDNFNDSYYNNIRANYFGCYLKYLNGLNETDMDSILAILTDIRDHSNFAYGYVFNGGLYDENGVYFSENGLEEIGTCVTLCTNIFKTLIVSIEDYMNYVDWDVIQPTDPLYHKFLTNSLIMHPDMDMTLYDQNHKRITPNEMTRSSVFNIANMPITKEDIDTSFRKYLNNLIFN